MIAPPLILVTGATGAIGPLVVKTFHDAGCRVRTLSMDPPPADAWPGGIEAITGDITDRSDVMKAVQGVSSVVHMAALLHIVNPPPELQEKYERVNVGGTSVVVEAAVKAGVKRIVFFSTIAVYGPSHGQILTEDSPPCPDTFYSRTKLAGEAIVLKAEDGDGEKIGSVLRFGAVYGPRVKGNYRTLVQALDKGFFIPIGNGSNRRTLVFDRDVGFAALLAASHENAAGKIFNVSDGCYHSLNQIIAAICDALGKRPPAFSIPPVLAFFSAGIMDHLARLTGLKTPVTRTAIEKYREDMAVDSMRIQTELGFRPKYDLTAGWRDTIREMRRMGMLIS